ncbi:hypothetical protein KFE25_002484 [Diacronema lutheri]|uniref:Uncharacterized protein n=2 Tax=Diacronema lutheri TaxID=2081491 RepID=A0A8J5XE57_DIALT|nr:hypothetical protein KFE25_002484 [Diacronema lutheri]
MELHGVLSREAYLPGDVIEAVVHITTVAFEPATPERAALTVDWLAARAHGEWRLPAGPDGRARVAPPALTSTAPGVIACDVLVLPFHALSYVVRIPLARGLPPTYRSAAPARAGARERASAGPAARLDYAVHIEAQRRVDGQVLVATLILPFDMLPDAWLASAPAGAAIGARDAGGWRWPTPAELAGGAPVPRMPRMAVGLPPRTSAVDGHAPDAGGAARTAAAPVHVELQLDGHRLGAVALPDGAMLSEDGSRPVALDLILCDHSPLVCVAACARLQAVERVSERVALTDACVPLARRVVTVGECDAHTEHARMVSLAVHMPLAAPPSLPDTAPVACGWQLALDMAVRPRAEPTGTCARVSWVHQLRVLPRKPARTARLPLAGSVRW